jgi:hypothetical protein
MSNQSLIFWPRIYFGNSSVTALQQIIAESLQEFSAIYKNVFLTTLHVPEVHKSVATTFGTIAPHIWGSSVWYSRHVTLLAPRTVRWLLDRDLRSFGNSSWTA